MIPKFLSGMFKSFRISVPKGKVLHGIEVKKQPVGRYFEVMERMGTIIYEVLSEAFPGMTPSNILAYFVTMTPDKLQETTVKFMTLVPKRFVAILRSIVGADDNPNWDNLTPTEMMEVVKEFWALNDLSDFFKNARSVLASVTKQTQTPGIGSSDFLSSLTGTDTELEPKSES